MRRCFGISGLFLWMLGQLPAASTSYVVLQKGPNSLVRVSSDGKSVTTIAGGFDGAGLAIDSAGNYVVGARSKLLRITPSGTISTIAEAPGDALWTTVAVDAQGSVIVADGRKPRIWRVAADGSLVVKVADYEAFNDSLEQSVGVAVDSAGDYWVVRADADPLTPGLPATARLYRISPTGAVHEIRLRGVRSGAFSGGAVLDGEGHLLITDHRESGILRVAKDGDVTRLAPILSQCSAGIWGLARDAVTGDIVAADPFCGTVLRTKPDGSGAETLTQFGKIGFPVAVVVEHGR